MAGACFGGSGKLVEVWQEGCSASRGRWSVLRFGGGSGRLVGRRRRLCRGRGTVVGTAPSEVDPGRLSVVAGSCAGVEGRSSVLRFGGESGTAVGRRGRLCQGRGDGGRYRVLEVSPGRLSGIAGSCAGVEGTVVGTTFSGAGSGRLSGIAASDAGSKRRRLILRFEVGTGARGETLDRASCLTGVCCWHG